MILKLCLNFVEIAITTSLHFQRPNIFLFKLQCSTFSSATLFLEDSQKNRQMKAGQINVLKSMVDCTVKGCVI